MLLLISLKNIIIFNLIIFMEDRTNKAVKNMTQTLNSAANSVNIKLKSATKKNENEKHYDNLETASPEITTTGVAIVSRKSIFKKKELNV